ncbi:uncharacterized protein PV09_08118 [Verruconis gallopava]|uniref:PDZ GRASP-type domain-containing protein n=1 Tax=Verruconis gallopava TaxID=253628 RepID=A0A0D2A164_9PEZI|nr:uncharacterized protein PV09_08118 [Verruconis gallopava]KIW00413.1 hypothetical protein PV09_08118 [Verruconis gallopava]
MFSRLNQFISRLGEEPKEQSPGTGTASGFQVLRNKKAELPLEPWFDFIIGLNGRNIENPDPNLFITEIRNCAGSSVSLGVWSAKGQRIREIYVSVPHENPLLGVSLQWMPMSVTEDVWHVLEVAPNSPADLAGLLPYGDYVIGSPDMIIHGESGLGQWVEENLDRPINLLVYNHEYDVTRPIEIIPSHSWGGQGALGCTLGYGALHRLPASLEEPPSAPGETMFAASNSFDEKRGMSIGENVQPDVSSPADLLIPANLALPGAPPKASSPGPQPGTTKRKPRAHHAAAAVSGLDDYLQEQEKQSREVDYPTSSPKPSGAVAPPPKAGPPSKTTNSTSSPSAAS